MEKKKVRCLECARLSEDRRYCKATTRIVTPSSERNCRFFLSPDWQERKAQQVKEM